MRKFYLVIFLFCLACKLNAQILNIPDPNFKQALIDEGIDLNSDGQIQQTEAEAKTGELSIHDPYSGGNITNLTGINSFINIKVIWLSWLQSLTNFNLNNLVNLKRIAVDNTPLSGINYTGTNNVNRLDLYGQTFSNLNFLSTFNNLDSLYWQTPPYYISNISLTGLPKLKDLYIDAADAIPFNLILSNLPELVKITNSTSWGNVSLNNLPKLESYNGGWQSLVYSFSTTQVPKLKTIHLNYVDRDSLDLSNCTSLTSLHFDNDYRKLKYLNIKNGVILNNLVVLNATSADSLKVCVDESEAVFVQNRLTQQGFNMSKIMVSPFCNFTEGGTFNTIKGIVRFDGNANGCDAGDAGMKQLNIAINEAVAGNFIRSTDSAGNYEHYAGKGTYTITPQFVNPYFTITPASASVYFDSANNYTATHDFCVTANGIKHDLEVAFLPIWQPARPGFDAGYALVYKNNGNTTQSGTAQLNYDAAKLTFVNESTGSATQSPGQLNWNFSNLKPFESKTINITLNVLPPAANNIGDTLLLAAAVNSANTDETPVNNTSNIKQPVQGSFDPNDKQCLEGNKVTLNDLDKNLHYQIRFQNEGTDTAFNVVIADTLSNNFDETSFQLLSSSHKCTIKRNGKFIEFNFSNIKLPYKAINEPESHGYVSFTVNPKNTLIAGDSLNNRASIYFDFNFPIVTNRSVTVVAATAVLPVRFEYINALPGSTANTINWKINCGVTGTVTIAIERSINGVTFETIKIITTAAVDCQQPFTYIDNNIASDKNYYRIKVTEDNGRNYYSNIVVLLHRIAEFSITSVRAANSNNMAVAFTSSAKKVLTLRLHSADGKLLKQMPISISAGNTVVNIPVQNIKAGVYIVSVNGNDVYYSIKQFINPG